MPKRKSKAKDIVARSISLVDSKGRTRISMGFHEEINHSSICLFGERDRSIQISADDKGGLYINLLDGTGKLALGLGITPDDRIGVSIFDHAFGNRTVIGSDKKGQPPQITLYHRGKPHWTAGKRVRSKSVR